MATNWIKYLRPTVTALALVAALSATYMRGFQTAHTEQQVIIEKMRTDAAQAAAEAEKAYAAKLEENARLAKEVNRIRRNTETRAVMMAASAEKRKTENKQGIENAITQDKNSGSGDCGLGTHSLQQYRRALGYDG